MVLESDNVNEVVVLDNNIICRIILKFGIIDLFLSRLYV